jgi:hypothetical protein
MTADEDENGNQLTAVVVPRLAATLDGDVLKEVLASRRWRERSEVAAQWHTGRLHALWQELRACTHGIEQDRLFELLGCMSSTGERFGLALAAGNEVAAWSKVRETPPSSRLAEAQREISHRALAELQGYYLLGTGHVLGSIVLRALALESKLRPMLLDRLGTSCVVGSDSPEDWPSLNIDTCRKLRRVARESDHAALRELPASITAIVQAQSWHKLDEMRGQDYHRRRPHSAPLDTAPMGSAWKVEPGVRLLSFGGQRPAESDRRAAEMTAVMFEVERLLLQQMTVLRLEVEAALHTLMPSDPTSVGSETTAR